MYRWIFLLSLFSCQSSSSDPLTQCLFERPLVIGASVSEGYGISDGGPSTVLSKLLYSRADVTNMARGGQKSTESTRGLKFEGHSVVLGLDLFFWDAAKNICSQEFEQNARGLFARFKEEGLPVIIGKVPVGAKFPAGIRHAGRTPCAMKINRLLTELCTRENNCLLYDPRDCFDAMEDPSRYFSDRLHTNEEGNKFCARIFADSGAHETLSCANRPAP